MSNYAAKIDELRSIVDYRDWVCFSMIDGRGKLIVIPTLDDLLDENSGMIENSHIFEDGMWCEIIDIREYIDLVRDQEFSSLLTLVEGDTVINPAYVVQWGVLQKYSSEIAFSNKLHMMEQLFAFIDSNRACARMYPMKANVCAANVDHICTMFEKLAAGASFKDCAAVGYREIDVEDFSSFIEERIDTVDAIYDDFVKNYGDIEEEELDKEKFVSELLPRVLHEIVARSLISSIG